MCVAHHCGLSVKVANEKVGGLSPYSRELRQLLYAVGNLPAVDIPEHYAHIYDILRFRLVKPAGAYILLHLADLRLSKRVDARKPFEQRRRHHIHPLIRTLRGKPRCYQQLMRFFIYQRALYVRIFAPEKLYHLCRAFFLRL